jgi:hypothetical protein
MLNYTWHILLVAVAAWINRLTIKQFVYAACDFIGISAAESFDFKG